MRPIVRNDANPRATRVDIGDYRSGITLYLYRNGLGISGHYDSCVGIEGGWISWERFDALRAMAMQTKAKADAALDAMPRQEVGHA